MIRSYKLFHPYKNQRQVIVSPPGSQHSSVVLDGGSNKSVRGVDFPLAYFIGWLLVFVVFGVGIFDYVIPYVLTTFGSMGGAR